MCIELVSYGLYVLADGALERGRGMHCFFPRGGTSFLLCTSGAPLSVGPFCRLTGTWHALSTSPTQNHKTHTKREAVDRAESVEIPMYVIIVRRSNCIFEDRKRNGLLLHRNKCMRLLFPKRMACATGAVQLLSLKDAVGSRRFRLSGHVLLYLSQWRGRAGREQRASAFSWFSRLCSAVHLSKIKLKVSETLCLLRNRFWGGRTFWRLIFQELTR